MLENKIAAIGDVSLQSGEVLRNAQLAYVTYGEYRPDTPVVLLTHGYTSSHFFAEPDSRAAEGSWHELVGPGKAIDTDRFFVVSSNMLGSCYGSTGPWSKNPETGLLWGPDFPQINVSDMVKAQRMLLDTFNITEIFAVAGPSYGGIQAVQWAVDYPSDVKKIVVAASGLAGPDGFTSRALRSVLSVDPNWNDGWYYEDPDRMRKAMADYREKFLLTCCVDTYLEKSIPDADARLAELRNLSVDWASHFDGNSLVTLAGALERFHPDDEELSNISAKVLLAQSPTDPLFPAAQGPKMVDRLRRLGIDAEFVLIDSLFGHLASGSDAQKWAPDLARFMVPTA